MPCLLTSLALFTPRFVIVLLVIFGDFIGRAYEGTLWPLLGFFFMPMTTLAYAAAINWNGSVSGLYFVMVLVAALLDLGFIGGSSRTRNRMRQRSRTRATVDESKIYDADPRDVR